MLTPADREVLMAATSERRFRRRDLVFAAGDQADAVYWIDSGHAAVRIDTAAGETVTLTVLGPGDSFGELALMQGGRRSASVYAMDDLRVRTLSRARLTQLRAQSAQMDRVIIDLLSGQVHRLTGQLIEALHVPVPQRVARQLLRLCEIYRTGEDSAVLGVTQDELAQLVGATRSTVNQALQLLVERGAVLLSRGQIEVASVRRLASVSPELE